MGIFVSASMTYSVGRWSLMGATAFAFVAATTAGNAQPQKPGKRAVATVTAVPVSIPESQLTRAELEAHLRFIASDELQGRRTGSPGSQIAARYLAEQFRQLGLKPAGDNGSYYQNVALQRTQPTATGTIRFGADSLAVGKQFVVVSGGAANQTAPSVYVGYGLTAEDYAGKDVKGKFVITQVGSSEAKTPRDLIGAMTEKRKLAAERGALGIIELFASPATPWTFANRYFNSEQISTPPAEATGQAPLLHIWADNGKGQLATLKDNKSVMVRTSGRAAQMLNTANVAGIIEGTDPTLKSEYVLLTAHYDHIGTGKAGVGSVTAADTIYNGARDNGMGTVALIAASKTLMAQRPKRSVIVVALIGEEVGMLGSRYYAEHPLVPLKQTVFNFNIDGAGYNDTKLISVIGLDRTGAKAEIEQAAAQFGLSVFADPAPEQGLFDRSDNVSFAAKGIPAPTLSEGFKAFDEELMKNYHQVSDNPETIDFEYLLKFCQSYARAARLIADRSARPFWVAGDKYEAAGKALYGQ
ncbi:M28 family peptidase [Fibrella sp. USSR17]|nr:peptidase M28 [Fibrella sp. ES10-3-2-2]